MQEKQLSLARFDPTELKLEEIRIETDKVFILFFGAETLDDWNIFPMVTFENFEILSSEWAI